MGMFGKKFFGGFPERLFFSKRPSHAQRSWHEPGLEHESDVHEGDMREIPDGPEVRLPQLLRRVGAFYRHGHDRRANPGSPHEELQFESIAPRPGFHSLCQRYRVTSKPALRIPES